MKTESVIRKELDELDKVYIAGTDDPKMWKIAKRINRLILLLEK